MKRWMLFGLLLVGMTAQAQTARKFTLNLGQSHCGCAWWRLLYAFEYP